MQSRRLWVDGRLEDSGALDVEQVATRLREKEGDDDSYAWIDLTTDSTDALHELAEVLGIHELSIEDALNVRERQKVATFDGHTLLRVVDVRFKDEELLAAGITLFVNHNVVLSVRDPAFPIDDVVDRLAVSKQLASAGTGYIVWAVMDVVVDDVMAVLEVLDDRSEQLSHDLFQTGVDQTQLQQDAFELRRLVARLRRVTVPLRELASSVSRRESTVSSNGLQPYFADVSDHAMHAVDWADSLRDHVATILDTTVALQGNRMNEIMKRVTSWAGIIAVPTFITGFFGQNLRFLGIETVWGAWLSVGLIVVSVLLLLWQFRRRDWL